MPQGQIRKALSGYYYVYNDGELVQCRGRGVFRNRGEAPLVGDIVDYTKEGDSDGYIMKIYPRKNELVRPPIANVDQALLVFSVKEPDFSTIIIRSIFSCIRILPYKTNYLFNKNGFTYQMKNENYNHISMIIKKLVMKLLKLIKMMRH